MNSPFPSCLLQNINIQWDDNALSLTPASRPYKYCLIFLQGRNMSVSNFLGVFLSMPLLELLTDFKIIFPIPPKRPGQVKPGVVRDIYSWYDYLDEPTVYEAKEKMDQIVKKELEGVQGDASKIFLGGFSQGCFLALFVMNEMKEKVGGLLLTAGFLLKSPKLKLKADLPPILVLHGMKDRIVKWNSEYGYGEFLDNENVKTILLEDMNHDLGHKRAQEVICSFLRGVTREAKPHL